MKIFLKELISRYFVICYHKLTTLQAHQYKGLLGLLRLSKIRESEILRFPFKVWGSIYKHFFSATNRDVIWEKLKDGFKRHTGTLFSLFLWIVYPLPICSFNLLTINKLVNNWRSTEESSYLWTFKMLEIIKANICNSAHVQGTLFNSQERSLNLAFAKENFLWVEQHITTYMVRLSHSTSDLFWFCRFLHLG